MSAWSRLRADFRADAAALPASERSCDRVVLALAAWTLLCNATVALQGGLHALSGPEGVRPP